MEILLTIGVFAIAAAICLQGFSKANEISKKRSELDTAVLLAQDTCEVLKHAHGDMDLVAELTGGVVTDDSIVIYRDGNESGSDKTETEFTVTVTVTDSGDGIGKANVTVSTKTRSVYELRVTWQEDTAQP